MSRKRKRIMALGLLCLLGLLPLQAQDSRQSDLDIASTEKGITLNAESMELAQLIKLLALKERVNITSSGPLTGSICLNLFDVSLEQVLDAALKPNGYEYRLEDGVYVIMKSAELIALETPSPTQQSVQLFRLKYINLEEAEKFIKPILSENGQIVIGEKPQSGVSFGGGGGGGAASAAAAMGGGAGGEGEEGQSDTGGDSSVLINVILIKDYPSVIQNVARLLEELDVRPSQVLVEATMLEVTLSDNTRMGVDFNALGGIDFSDLGGTSNLFSVDLDDAAGTQLDHTFWGARNSGFATNDPSEGFSFGILHDKAGLFIEALENIVDATVIANPKILALNRQKAEIKIGGSLGYYGTEIINDGISQRSVLFLDTGTQLQFRPFITGDGYVRLEIHPKRSSGTVDVTTSLPSETTSEVTTNIMIKDGDTVVIGGLIEERDELIVKRLPFLGSIPLVGWLFRREETSTRRTEIIVLITPHIIDPSRSNAEAEAEVEAFRKRQRLFREGFTFCSRTLFAEKHLAKARQYLQEGDLDWGRFHVSRAASEDPLNREVAELKTQIDKAMHRKEGTAEPMEEYLRSQL